MLAWTGKDMLIDQQLLRGHLGKDICSQSSSSILGMLPSLHASVCVLSDKRKTCLGEQGAAGSTIPTPKSWSLILSQKSLCLFRNVFKNSLSFPVLRLLLFTEEACLLTFRICFNRLFTHGIVGSRNAKLVSDWIILSQRPTKERDEDHTVRSLKVCRWSLLPIQFSQYVWLTCYVENLITHRNSISLSLGSYLSSFSISILINISDIDAFLFLRWISCSVHNG